MPSMKIFSESENPISALLNRSDPNCHPVFKPSPANRPLIRLVSWAPLGFELDHLAMELPAIFVLNGGNADYAPHFLLAVVPTNKHRCQLHRIETIGLGSTPTPADLNRRGVDDDVLNAPLCKNPVYPETIPARFVARHYRSGCWEVESDFGLFDLVHDETNAASWHRANPRRLARADSEGYFPGAPAEF